MFFPVCPFNHKYAAKKYDYKNGSFTYQHHGLFFQKDRIRVYLSIQTGNQIQPPAELSNYIHHQQVKQKERVAYVSFHIPKLTKIPVVNFQKKRPHFSEGRFLNSDNFFLVPDDQFLCCLITVVCDFNEVSSCCKFSQIEDFFRVRSSNIKNSFT